MTRALLLAALFSAATPALAEDGPVALWSASSGPLPPEYAWDTAILFRADGTVEVQHCTGYVNEGLACQTATGKADPAALEAIFEVTRTSELATRPAREEGDIPVGAGFVLGTVWLDGAEIALPPFPLPEDAERVTLVLDTIRAAVPPDLAALVE
jgi:hypothetical protein